MAERVLGENQRKKFNKLLKNQGKKAAQAYRQKIMARGPGGGEGAQGGDAQGGAGDGSVVYNNVSNLLNKQDQAVGAGNTGQAAKFGQQIQNQVMQNPLGGYVMGEREAQNAFNQNIMANRVNQDTIGGSRQYVTDPATGQTKVVDSLDQGQQNLYDQQLGSRSMANQAFMQGLQGGNFGSAFDLSGLPQAPNTSDLAGERERLKGQFYNASADRIKQEAEDAWKQQEDVLYSRGNVQGTPAYDKARERFDESLKDSLQTAENSANDRAGQEFERFFNIGSQGRSNALGEQAFARTQPLSELATLQGFGGGPTAQPNFFNFQPVSYNAPGYLNYLQTGLDTQMGRRDLDIKQQQVNLAGRGGGGGGPAPGPSFSFGGLPPTTAPAPGQFVDPAQQGFQDGFNSTIGGMIVRGA